MQNLDVEVSEFIQQLFDKYSLNLYYGIDCSQ